MQWFPDVVSFLKDAGVAITAAFVFGYILLYSLTRKLSSLFESHGTAVQKIDSIERRSKEIYALVQSFSDNYQDHIYDTKRMADEELWKHCPVERCPNLQKVINFLEQISRELKDFADSAKDSRSTTQASITDVSEKIDKFINGLGSEFIMTLRDMRKN